MPFGPIEIPPLGLALLTAEAKRSGLSTRALYPTFWFAEKIGYFTYNAISKAIGGFQVSEWIFSSAAFPGFRPNGEQFLKDYVAWECEHDKDKYDLLFGDETAFREKCWEVRHLAEEFIGSVAEWIVERNPKIVGCSSTYYQNCSSLALLRRLKELNPEIITMMGGANCESTMGVVMKHAFPWVDIVVSGEADELFVPLCRTLLKRGLAVLPEELPYGVITADTSISALSIKEEPPVAMVSHLSNLPIPDYTDYFDECGRFRFLSALPPAHLSIETSRGCWWGQKRGCTFCGSNHKRASFRVKSADHMLEELRILHKRYGIDKFIATDNILDMSYFRTVFPELAAMKPSPYSFFFSAKSNLSESHCHLLADAGVFRLQPGIESLHDELLRLMNKGNKAIENVALLKFVYENGIKTIWNILVDIPGERDEWYQETASWLPLIAHLQPPHKIMSIHFDRFSAYHRQPGRYGLDLIPIRWYSNIYPLSPEELQKFAYRFERRTRRDREETEGKKALVRAILDWMELYTRGSSGNEPPTLTIREEAHRSVIKDTRPCAVKGEILLTDIPHMVYRACRIPRTSKAIRKTINSWTNGTVGMEFIDSAIAFLIEHKLLLQIGGQFLALAVREPLRPFVYPPDYNLPRLQSTMRASQKSYWEVLGVLDKRASAKNLSTVTGKGSFRNKGTV
jgi:magnesium-protoporphyrin IX monomethyl ester (oxidative) cyclase